MHYIKISDIDFSSIEQVVELANKIGEDLHIQVKKNKVESMFNKINKALHTYKDIRQLVPILKVCHSYTRMHGKQRVMSCRTRIKNSKSTYVLDRMSEAIVNFKTKQEIKDFYESVFCYWTYHRNY